MQQGRASRMQACYKCTRRVRITQALTSRRRVPYLQRQAGSRPQIVAHASMVRLAARRADYGGETRANKRETFQERAAVHTSLITPTSSHFSSLQLQTPSQEHRSRRGRDRTKRRKTLKRLRLSPLDSLQVFVLTVGFSFKPVQPCCGLPPACAEVGEASSLVLPRP